MLVRWLLSKWVYGLIIAGGLAFLGGVYATGYNAAQNKCNAAAMQAEIDTLKRDLQIAQNAAISARAKQAELDDLATIQEDALNVFRKMVAERGANSACLPTDDEFEQLLKL